MVVRTARLRSHLPIALQAARRRIHPDHHIEVKAASFVLVSESLAYVVVLELRKRMGLLRGEDCYRRCQGGGPSRQACLLQLALHRGDLSWALAADWFEMAFPELVVAAFACAGLTGTLRFRPQCLRLGGAHLHHLRLHFQRSCLPAAVVWIPDLCCWLVSTEAMCWLLVSLSHLQYQCRQLRDFRLRSSWAKRRCEALQLEPFEEVEPLVWPSF